MQHSTVLRAKPSGFAKPSTEADLTSDDHSPLRSGFLGSVRVSIACQPSGRVAGPIRKWCHLAGMPPFASARGAGVPAPLNSSRWFQSRAAFAAFMFLFGR